MSSQYEPYSFEHAEHDFHPDWRRVDSATAEYETGLIHGALLVIAALLIGFLIYWKAS